MTDRLTEACTWAGGAALVASALAAPLVLALLRRTGSRQTVSQYVPEHADKQGTPTMGGLIVLAGLAAGILAGGGEGTGFSLVLLVWYGIIGLLDDDLVPRFMPGKRGLGWMPKLALQVVPFAWMWWMAPGTPWSTIAVTAFVVMFFANAFNFADGMDGLAGGLGILLALAIAALSDPASATGARTAPVLVALALALVPFLVLNAPPAKVFMGDVGSLPIGAVLGLSFLEATLFHDPEGLSLDRLGPGLLIAGVLIVELLPVPLQIASAKLRKGKRLFPFRTPVHHAFQAAGWPETRVVWLFLLVQFVLAAAGLAWGAWAATGGFA